MTILRGTLVGFAGLALLSLPTMTAATAAPIHEATSPAAARANTAIRFLGFDHLRGYGTPTRIRGQVIATVGGRQGSVRNVRVRLLRKLDGTSRWRYLGTKRTTSSRSPVFRFAVTSIGNAHYRVRFSGNGSYQPARGATAVSVHRRITGRIEDRTGRFHGRVTPRYARHIIHLEKRSCGACAWHRVRSARTGGRGRYSFKVGAPNRGRWYWRVSTPAKPRFIRSYSGVFTTRLR